MLRKLLLLSQLCYLTVRFWQLFFVYEAGPAGSTKVARQFKPGQMEGFRRPTVKWQQKRYMTLHATGRVRSGPACLTCACAVSKGALMWQIGGQLLQNGCKNVVASCSAGRSHTHWGSRLGQPGKPLKIGWPLVQVCLSALLTSANLRALHGIRFMQVAHAVPHCPPASGRRGW